MHELIPTFLYNVENPSAAMVFMTSVIILTWNAMSTRPGTKVYPLPKNMDKQTKAIPALVLL